MPVQRGEGSQGQNRDMALLDAVSCRTPSQATLKTNAFARSLVPGCNEQNWLGPITMHRIRSPPCHKLGMPAALGRQTLPCSKQRTAQHGLDLVRKPTERIGHGFTEGIVVLQAASVRPSHPFPHRPATTAWASAEVGQGKCRTARPPHPLCAQAKPPFKWHCALHCIKKPTG